jgi:predicted small secreted protein
MDYLVSIKKILLIAFAAVALTACATQKKVGKQVSAGSS